MRDHSYIPISFITAVLAAVSLWCNAAVASQVAPLLLSGFSKKQIIYTSHRASDVARASFDTIHIIAFMVQFKRDTSRLTTGTGLFGDLDEKDESRFYLGDSAYIYDQLPHDRAYFERQLDFAAHYFATVSRGHLNIRYSIHTPAGNEAYAVPQTMPYYSPGGKKKKETWNEYYYRKTVGLMRFVKDAMTQIAADPTPFAGLKQDRATGIITNAHGHPVVFLIIHAGASYLTDGGKEGAYGQDTPSDVIDAFISKDWFTYFRDTLRLGADGIYVRKGDDSLLIDEIMLIPETSNQDGLNWGIHGILVNQIARQLGIPDLWSTSSGITGVGAFCIMDFAGYSAGNGFVPPWPSAWVRMFMGWERPAVARPGENRSFRLTAVSVANPDSDTTMLLIPINDHEYFLLENRQRCLDGDESVFRYDTSEHKDTIYISGYPYNVNIQRVIDSTSGKNASNVILRVKNYDVSLPASGVLVWHVDERIIASRIGQNMVNADSTYRGVALVEADGIGDLGIMFQDMLGQTAFDYGGAEDVFPHRSIRFGRGNFEVDSLGPYTRPSTKTNDGGHSNLTIRIAKPLGARVEKTRVRSYYVDNYAARDFTVEIRWSSPPSTSLSAAAYNTIYPSVAPSWPRRMIPDSVFFEPVVCDIFHSDRARELAVVSSGGRLYLWSADRERTQSLGTVIDTFVAVKVLQNSIGLTDSSRAILSNLSVRYVPLPGTPTAMPSSINGRLYIPLGTMIVLCDSVFSRSRLSEPDTMAMRTLLLPSKALTPVTQIEGGRWVVGTEDGWIFACDTGSTVVRDSVRLTYRSPVSSIAALHREVLHFACIQENGVLTVVNLAGTSLDTVQLNGIGPYSIVTGDIDNDGENEIVVADSRQGLWCFNRDLSRAQGWERAPIDWASVYTYRENHADTARALAPVNLSSPALADINRDGHLDIVIGGTNGLYAFNYKGVLLYGWPSYLDNRFWYWRQSVRVSPVVVTDRQATPLIIFAAPTGENETFAFFHIDSIRADRYRVFFRNAAGERDSASNVRIAEISSDSLYRGKKIDSIKVDRDNAKEVKVFYTRSDGLVDSVGGLKPGAVDTMLVYGDSLVADYVLPGGLVDARDASARRPGFIETLHAVGAVRQSPWPLSTGSAPATAPILCDFEQNDTMDLFVVSSSGWIYRWILFGAAGTQNDGWLQVGYDGGRSFSYPSASVKPVSLVEPMLQLFSYPNPTDGASSVQLRFKFGGPARKVRLDIYTYTGHHVYSWKAPSRLYEVNWRDWSELPEPLSLKSFGPGVYRCRMEAEIDVGSGNYRMYHTYWKMAVVK